MATSQSSWTKRDVDGKTIIGKTNEEGARISFSWVAEGVLAMAFDGNASITLNPSVCPTFQIDNEPSIFFPTQNKRCDVSEVGARYTIETTSSAFGKTLLDALMNGKKIVFRFITFTGLYGKTAFSLKDSKQILLPVN